MMVPGTRKASLLVVGVGGLGSAALLSLARAARENRIHAIRLVDDDVVAASNLHRQVIYASSDVGRAKVDAAAAFAERLFPNVSIEPRRERLVAASAARLLDGIDVVLDGSDNFATKFLVNDVCVRARVPFVHAAAIRWQGQLVAVDSRRGDPCFRCLFEEPPASGIAGSCAEAGVVGPVVGVVGALLGEAAIRLLDRAFSATRGPATAAAPRVASLVIYDGLAGTLRTVRYRKNPACVACDAAPDSSLVSSLFSQSCDQVPAC